MPSGNTLSRCCRDSLHRRPEFGAGLSGVTGMKPALQRSMTKQIWCVWTAVSMLGACAGPAQTAPGIEPGDQQSAKVEKPTPSSNVNPDAKLLADFNAKVKEYEDLRDDLKKKAPPLKKTNNPDEIGLAERGLAQQIKVARSN